MLFVPPEAQVLKFFNLSFENQLLEKQEENVNLEELTSGRKEGNSASLHTVQKVSKTPTMSQKNSCIEGNNVIE